MFYTFDPPLLILKREYYDNVSQIQPKEILKNLKVV